jgi:hypothetical protein
MKKLFILVILFSTLAACNILDVEPQNSIPADAAFKDKEGIKKGILGAYTPFQYLSYYGRNYLIFSDLGADNLDQPVDGTSVDYRQIDNNNILPENGGIEGIWGSAYEGINIANNVLSKVPGMSDMTLEEKNAALAELYFIRALNHFNLLNCFGAIPVKITPTAGTAGVDAPREPVNVVYDQIIDDLLFAELHLNASTSVKVRASKYAATALLARVYLYKGDYALAIDKATAVIDDGGYQLLDGYSDIFTDGSAESIFEIDFTELSRNRIAEYNFPKTLNGRREVEPSPGIVNGYEIDDLRYEASLAFAGALPYAIKYDDLAKGADNVIVLRLAEMYLIRAEAEARLEGNVNDIQDDINEIRSRADLPETTTTSYVDLLLEVEQERRVEFAFEGHRWFDLVRTGRATTLLPNVTNNNKTRFPIPLSEIQTNKSPEMTQNPGY